MPSHAHSLISLSASVFISAEMSPTHTHDKCSLVVNNHTVTSQIIFTDTLLRGPGLAGTRMSPFWILLVWVMGVVVTTGAIRHAKLQSKCCHQQTDTRFFYRPDVLLVGCTTAERDFVSSQTDPDNVCFTQRCHSGRLLPSTDLVYTTRTDPNVSVQFTTDNNGNIVKVCIH